ncbi:putative cell wall-associated serine proteinase, partial [human gut metagenome]
ESNKREFSRDVTVADGDILLIVAGDSMGNTLAGGIPVVVDMSL